MLSGHSARCGTVSPQSVTTTKVHATSSVTSHDLFLLLLFTSVDDLGHTLEEEQCCFVACGLKPSLTTFSDCCYDNKISQGIVLTQEFILIVIRFYNGMHNQLCFNVRMRHNQNSSACPQRHSQTPLLVSSAPSVSREP